MDFALKLARQGMQGVGANPMVGCVIEKEGNIIAQGYHQTFGEAHGEINALEQINHQAKDATLYVTLEPCIMCAGAMLHARVDRVVYGATDPKTGAAGSILDVFSSKQINHQTVIEGGTMAEECGQLLRDFFKERR